MLLLEFYDAAEVVNAQERGFARLPRKRNYFSSLALYVLPDVELQNFVRHPPAAIFLIEMFLLKIKAILAIQVTNRADWLRHDVK